MGLWTWVLHLGMDQYLLIPFQGDEHPFTSYFDVHHGYKVLTHPHLSMDLSLWDYLNGIERKFETTPYRSIYPLVNQQKAMENGPFIDGLLIKNAW